MGTVTSEVSPLESETNAPPTCAGMERFTEPHVANPPSTGLAVTLESFTTGVTVNEDTLLVAPSVP